MNFDINIAMLKRDIDQILKNEENRPDKKSFEKQMEYMMDKLSTFSFKKTFFCDGLFSMIFPSELFIEPTIMKNIYFFQSQKESITAVIKVIESEQTIDIEKIQADYMNQMHQSKQQTKIDISHSTQVEFGTIYYFTAIHSMPGGELIDFIILFQTPKNMVFLDINFNQKDYLFWKPIFCKLCSTIHLEGET